jgi:hypothetical protein
MIALIAKNVKKSTIQSAFFVELDELIYYILRNEKIFIFSSKIQTKGLLFLGLRARIETV